LEIVKSHHQTCIELLNPIVDEKVEMEEGLEVEVVVVAER
jgi:hypothetical protein